MSYEVADTLRKALDVLRERGLAKGMYEDTEGHVCSRGAARLGAMGRIRGYFGATQAQQKLITGAEQVLTAVIEENWPERSGVPGSSSIAVFNDHPDTTQDDVERAFEKAIARAEEMGL